MVFQKEPILLKTNKKYAENPDPQHWKICEF